MRERTVVYTVPLVEKKCAVCGKVFEGVSKSRFCSRACKNKADYYAHAEQRRQSRRERYHRDKAGE